MGLVVFQAIWSLSHRGRGSTATASIPGIALFARLAMEAGLEAVNLTEPFNQHVARQFSRNLWAPMSRRCPTFRATRANERNFSQTIIGRRRSWRRTSFAGYQCRSRRVCSTSAPRRSRHCQGRRRGESLHGFSRDRCSGRRQFDLDGLDPDVRAYKNAGALLKTVRKLQGESIDRAYKLQYDITRDPLEFAVNNQHEWVASPWIAGARQPRRVLRGRAAGTHGTARRGGAQRRPGSRHALRRARGRAQCFPSARARSGRARALYRILKPTVQ